MAIKILSKHIVNQINAGEVIDGPYSVVKEFIDNAIDANATKIKIVIEDYGKGMIFVKDNGIGMTKSDLTLCTKDHATSKLPDEDLYKIKTMGFRGEALAAISSVSNLTILSKTKTDKHGYQLTCKGDSSISVDPCPAQDGTTIESKNLFYNAPARLKFLKSNQREITKIKEVVLQFAMVNHNISFKMEHNKRKILSFLKSKSKDDRIKDVLGSEFIENSKALDYTYDYIKITGRASIPSFSKSTSQYIYLCVNNRIIKDKTIVSGIKSAYSDLLIQSRSPVVFLDITVPLKFVDINVHPAKTEVRFLNIPKVRSAVISAIKKALEFSHTSSVIADQFADAFMPISKPDNNVLYQSPSHKKLDLTDTKMNINYATDTNNDDISTNRYAEFHSSDNNDTYTATNNLGDQISHDNDNEIKTLATGPDDNSQNPIDLGVAKAQLDMTYIISESHDKIHFIDQHAAHERIMYEDFKRKKIHSTKLVIPEVITMDQIKKDALIYANLSQYGIILEKFGNTQIIVKSVPHLLSKFDLNKLMHDIAEKLCEDEFDDTSKKVLNSVLSSIACHNSIRSGKKMTQAEMDALIKQIEETKFAAQCNHGRPTFISISKKKIESLFER